MAAKTPFALFATADEITFAVRILPPGARYGNRNVLTNDHNEPLIEFYDTRWADDGRYVADQADPTHVLRSAPGFGPLGQFVSRYCASDLLKMDDTGTRFSLGRTGLCLDGGVAAWKVDAATMRTVCTWVAKTLADQPTLMHKG